MVIQQGKVDFCNKIHDNLDSATFEGKRRIPELLDVQGTLAIENDEKVIYVSCHPLGHGLLTGPPPRP